MTVPAVIGDLTINKERRPIGSDIPKFSSWQWTRRDTLVWKWGVCSKGERWRVRL